jgi:hypothetical protein
MRKLEPHQRKRRDPEKQRESAKKWYYANKARARANNVQWRVRNRFKVALESSKMYARQGEYVPCNATVREISEAYTGYCVLCGAEESDIKLHMDHDHKTGKFRGWLCFSCNVGLGKFKDSVDLLILAAEYLEKS